MKKVFQICIFILLGSSNVFSQWEELDDTPFVRDHGIAFSFDGIGYLLSGNPEASAWGSKTFFKYNPVEDSWEQLDDYPGPPRGVGMGTQYEGKA